MPEMTGSCQQSNVCKPVSNYRRLLSQILAATACNTLLLDLSAVVSVSTVVIGELHNSTGGINLDDDMASWLGSIPFICEPAGGVLSGVLTELLGRKKVMVLINVPFLLGWILTCTASSFGVLLLASIIHGLTLGLVEAPICTYVGEVCQPEIRGTLGSSGGIFYQVGGLLVLLLGTLTDWRTTAGVSAVIPIVTAVFLIMVPEAPVWLLSKGRETDAKKALCWLRGWVEPSAVQKEYDELVNQYEMTKEGIVNDSFIDENRISSLSIAVTKFSSQTGIANECQTDPVDTSNGGFLSRIKALAEPNTRRPLMLIVVFMFLITWSGYVAVRPFMVTVFDKFKLPLGSQWSTVIQAVSGVLGAIAITGVVHRAGKRPLSIAGQVTATLCTFLLGAYCYWELEPAEKNSRQLRSTWVPLLLFAVMSFLNSFLGMIPWSMLCEVFPFRTRSIAAGLCSAGYYFFAFIASKSYLSIQRDLDLHGTFWLYCGINAAGIVFIYFQLPETEGRSLHSIEQHFATGASARKKPPLE